MRALRPEGQTPASPPPGGTPKPRGRTPLPPAGEGPCGGRAADKKKRREAADALRHVLDAEHQHLTLQVEGCVFTLLEVGFRVLFLGLSVCHSVPHVVFEHCEFSHMLF